MFIRTRVRAAPALLMFVVASQALPASAQSLALTYDLEVAKDSVQPVARPRYTCAAFNWLTSTEGCGAPGDASPFAHSLDDSVRPDSRRASAGGTVAVTPIAVPREAFGTDPPAPDTRLRALDAGRAADVSLRVGAQVRSRASDDTRELSPFNGRAYEGSLQNNLHKALGLELHVPIP